MKKILILNGSSRPHAFTEALIDSFRQGAESKGNQVEVVHLREKRIHHCLGCLHGGKDYEHPCTQRDDMDEIYRLYRQSDVIVLATPLFFWSYSGLLKDALDRLWALAEQSVDELHGNNKSGLLLCAAGGSHPQPLIDHFDYLMKRMEWANLGHYVLCHTDDMDKRNIPEIAGARELGEKIAIP
ncbi:flavodoxin family protein [Prevotella sp. AGR2160]|uniref:flavodoxin family protein n=1 Tax=Prevotella sp. AGR2160 TaxID=1280674 RepID=UPI00048E250B|nr:flavodoxin family protein [Prevotella sp. AGR2160]